LRVLCGLSLLVVHDATVHDGDRCKSKHLPKVSKCTGCPPMYNNKMCASTTRYNDQTKAACGCGDSDPVPKDWWTLTAYTAAMDCKNLHTMDPFLAWCPSGCGSCYRLCSTGGSMHGHRPKEGVCRTFKITNRCGDGFKQYPMWCSNNLSAHECKENPHVCRQLHSTNHYGYPAHFDLQDFHHQILSGLGWDNVEVTFEKVKCKESWKGQDWNCYCDSAEGEKGTGSPPDNLGDTEETVDDDDQDSSSIDGDLDADSGECGQEWAQCGGKHFKGRQCCQEGCHCKHLGEHGNVHYSHQCVPNHWKGCKFSAERGISPASKFDADAQPAEVRALPAGRAILVAAPALSAVGALAAAAALFWRARRQRSWQGATVAVLE